MASYQQRVDDYLDSELFYGYQFHSVQYLLCLRKGIEQIKVYNVIQKLAQSNECKKTKQNPDIPVLVYLIR